MEAPIVAVTVFPDGARVTRRVTVTPAPGDQRVAIGGLPLELDRDSVRVDVRGATQVLWVEVAAERHSQSPDPAVRDLQRAAEETRQLLAELADRTAVADTRADLLTGVNRRAASAFAKALTAGEIEPDRIAALSDSLSEQLTTVLAGKRELRTRTQEGDERLRALERELAERRAQREPDRQVVLVGLDGDTDGDIELELSYVVDNAQWTSSYDLRLTGDRLTLTWHAEITQSTGEDWPDCALALSTARPARTARLPETTPWFLDRVRPPMPVAPAAFGAPAGAPMPSGVPDGVRARSARAYTPAVEHGDTATTYRPAHTVAVPTDGTAHRTTVAVVDLATVLDHITFPAQGTEAFLRATATNTSEHTLRPGRASVFHDSEFVGTTSLDTWAPGEEVELNLGVDDRIRVDRELVRRTAGKAVIGTSRRREVRYRITVGNHGRRPTTVTVLERIPVSRDEDIVVKDVTCQPTPQDRTDLGELTWRIPLAEGAATDVTVGFRVDTARGVEIAGWRD
ncbi:mucoidy inhibitor MuiA family protein [Nocardia stercoris]|uniref:Mucoidy inhibitor MuiA family protein n=1 Tax=Nocardia stercoris TaxID=2483361 RepID=A0A3M2L3N9_9NOCA|nr:mucoidy inhibitor MuiA family protein [Nocardia stercoris]